ncbi:MAG: ParB/RepB/Spo0J family partition protein [Candidatus Aminicenantes bacterium]|nr:ParB/RepB/Spo0J family partition protein [Candidatus Aminicenantes bacterium]
MKKQALGKGLKAFLSDEYTILKEDSYAEVDIELLKSNPNQPRKIFDPIAIDELALSIRESGILQPIVVVVEDGKYKIIVGERRWRAAQKAGLKKLPVLIKRMDEEKQIEASLIENIQREDLNPLEIAQAYQKMVETLRCTQAQVAEKVGKDRASVTNYIRLLKLPDDVKKRINDGTLSMGHARALVTLEDPEMQGYLAQKIVQKKLSVRDTEKMIKSLKKQPPVNPAQRKDPDILALEEEFIRLLGTKASISGTQEKGVIKIHYFSLEDLNRIFEQIKGVRHERTTERD